MKTGRTFGASVGAKAIQTLLARILISIVGVATGVFIARILGPEGKGAYSGVQLLLSIPVAVTGGAGAAITYLMTKKRLSIADLFPALATTFALVSAITLAGCAVYAALHGWTLESAAFALAMPPATVLSWQQNYYVAVDRIRNLNRQMIGLSLFTLVFALLFCGAFRWGIAGALAAWLTGLYACALIVVADMIACGGRLHLCAYVERLRDFGSMGGQSALNAGLGLLNYRIDSLILIALLGLPVFGIYSVAVSIGEVLFMIARPVNTAIGREIGVADETRAAQITAHVVRMGFAICLVCAVPLAFFAPPLVHLVYGSRFDAAAMPLRLLLPGILAFASTGTFASFFIFQLGRPMLVTVINVVMIVVQTVACFALVPRYGPAGAAAASSVTYIIGAAVNTVLFSRATKLGPALIWIPRTSDVRRGLEIAGELLKRKAAKTPSARRCVTVVTGAAGGVAAMVIGRLRERYVLRLTDCVAAKKMGRRDPYVRADLRSLRAVRRAVRGADAIVHFGAVSKEAAFEDVMAANIRGTYNVLEAARLEGVRRVIIASSGHVTGFYPRSVAIDETVPFRPDSMYGVSKAFGEVLGRFYADKYGLEVFCVRIGHVCEQPQDEIDRHIWISPRDLAQLLEVAIERQPLTFEVLYATSANALGFWNIDRARSMGYEPQDRFDASLSMLGETQKNEIAWYLQGESFAERGFTGPASRVYKLDWM